MIPKADAGDLRPHANNKVDFIKRSQFGIKTSL